MKACPKCGKNVNSEYLFCPTCGENLKNCRYCDKELPDGAIYCPYCGKPINAETTISYNHSNENPAFVNPSYVPQIKSSSSHGIERLSGLATGEILIIPKGRKEIKPSEFEKRHKIKQVVLPEGLEIIGSCAFRECTNLIKINLPSSLQKIGDQVFFGCDKLKSAGPYGSDCSIEFGATDQILERMFYNCQYLTRVILPDGIRTIGKQAFLNCKAMEKLVIPTSVKEIGAEAFESCSNLKNLALPNSVEKIGIGAFHGCGKLCDKDGFVIIRSVLYSCMNIGDIIRVPQGVTTIDNKAFLLGTSISNDTTVEIVIPDTVVNITNTRAFLACKKLEKVTPSENASEAVKEVIRLISNRTEERRIEKQRIEKQRMEETLIESRRIKTPNALSIFYRSNSSIISKNAYQDILARFQAMDDKVMNCSGDRHPSWTESETMISLSDTWSHWVGHDDTVSKSINLTFSKVKNVPDDIEWSTESDWPCAGQMLLFDKSWSERPKAIWDSSYSYETHKAWLLKEPYGISGIWQFEYKDTGSRY